MFRWVFSALLLFLLFAQPFAACGEEVSSIQLIDQTKAFDRQEVVFSGEVIGDILNAGDHVWLNVSDGSNAIGVWAKSSLASDIQIAGRYSQHGDSIRVSGIFNRACPEHGGDMDLHADSIELINRGYPTSHAVPEWKGWMASGLAAGALACMAVILIRTVRRSPGWHRP